MVSVAALLIVCFPHLAGATVGVLHADTDAQVFVNSIFMAEDKLTTPVLPLNGVRRFPTEGALAEVVPIRGRLNAGDLLAIGVFSDRPTMVNWTLNAGGTMLYPGLAGVIAAWDDGTMTSKEWLCTDDPKDSEEVPWHSRAYNDSAWAHASEQDLSCCPWRDPELRWRALAARWIGPATTNTSGPRVFYCRYHVPGASSSRLPARFTEMASLTAPQVNLVRALASASQVQISFTLERAAIVSCSVVDARYKLRSPIAFELQESGVTSGVLQPMGVAWVLLGEFFTDVEYDAAALARYTASSLQDCQSRCDESSACNGITYYEAGVHLATNTNCKLVASFDPNSTKAPSDLARFTHMELKNTQLTHSISVTGILLPGTIYDSYCSTEDPVTGEHSVWDNVQMLSNRTAGCIDCGATSPPEVKLLGGWASSTELNIVVSSNKAGRVFCAAVPVNGTTASLTHSSIKVHYHSNFLTQAHASAPVKMTGLTPGTEHEMACIADSDGGVESSTENLEASRRHWFTEALPSPIMGMSIQPQTQDGLLTIAVFVQMEAMGLLHCRDLEANATRRVGVPRAAWLQTHGTLQRVEDLTQETPSSFEGLEANSSYEVYCTAVEVDPNNSTGGGGGDAQTPYPVVSILDPLTADYDVIRIYAKVSRGPSSVYCMAVLWSYTTQDIPAQPTEEELLASPFRLDVFEPRGATAIIEITVPYIGSIYDVYCYAEEYMEPAPPGAEEPARNGMNAAAVKKTRRTVQTVGASHKNDGWLCISGHPCNITDERGPPRLPLAPTHRILVRDTPCPGHCYCNGEEDPSRKGAWCSPVSHDPLVAAPLRNAPDDVDRRAPRGDWCYVRRGVCFDEEPSPTYNYLYISYAACTFNLTAGREGSGPPGFPFGGLASVRGPTTFAWGSNNVIAEGKAYYLCWCDSATSPCFTEVDFRLALGRLHVAGPNAQQQEAVASCTAGLQCELNYFEGHGLEDGSRLVVLEDGPLGCLWEKAYPLDPPGIVGFPNGGVSQPATRTGRAYSWGSEPVLAAGGHYILCWCGQTRKIAGAGGGTVCPDVRPVSGENFLAPAGRLTVLGPYGGSSLMYCSLGLVCEVSGIQGIGVNGGDRVIVTSELCGEASPLPDGWATGIEELEAAGLADGWLEGGWLRYGPQLSDCVLASIGAPVATACQDSNVVLNASQPRGIVGFPNAAMSETSTLPGYYYWGGPAWAFAGDYRLCWCADLAPACDRPEHFRVMIGMLRLEGPSVLPLVSQLHICVRGKACSVREFRGRMPFNSQLFITEDACTGPAPPGAPNDGISLPSLDSFTYSWGSEPIMAEPGKYRLCWCPQIGQCTTPEAFGAFSGILQVKGLLGDNIHIYCTLGQPCAIEGIEGEGLEDGDEIRVLTTCGHGETPAGFEGEAIAKAYGGGTKVLVPATRLPGRFSLCWCPAGNADSDQRVDCSHPSHYNLFLGYMDVGGPVAGSSYVCYEWQPCEIPILQGTALHDGDRLLVAPPGTDCALGELPGSLARSYNGTLPKGFPAGRRRRFPHATPEYHEFPQKGVSTGASDGGYRYAWGSELVRTPPGIYTLCWCNFVATGCTEEGPFLVPAGSLRVGTYAEHAYLNRPPDPVPRDFDQWYAYNLAWPLPVLFCLILFAGWRRSGPEPPVPPIFRPKLSLARVSQSKARHLFEAKQVQATRDRAEASARSEGLRGSAMGTTAPDVPDFRPEDAVGSILWSHDTETASRLSPATASFTLAPLAKAALPSTASVGSLKSPTRSQAPQLEWRPPNVVPPPPEPKFFASDFKSSQREFIWRSAIPDGDAGYDDDDRD